ncbi:BTAD domain-containing putative transcriptional regulator [Microbispora bryophytorum]|uniref:BTAD domain-containing putative transcriptional regulator n=1 Tax=Microbispora bryophytorum TaxID=1460882 RepID=UPI0033CA1F9A
MQGDTPGVGMSFAVLGPLDVRRDGQPVEVGGPSGYRLAVSADQVDLHRFARLAGEGAAALAAGDPGRAAGLLREVLGLWRGAPLTHLPDAEVEVARLEGLRIAAAEDRIEAELALGRHADLITELRLLVAAHPLRERPHGQLMRALYGAGRRVEALAAYEEARSVFADLLGADPSPALAGLHLAMLRGEPPEEGTRPSPEVTPRGLARVERGLAPVNGPSPRAARRGNLRARLTSFVGRDDDVGRIGGFFAADRLVTLLGPGGAGKTRPAVESAEAIAARVPDGVWLVELAPVGDAAEVPQAALTALGLRDTGLVPVRAAPAMPSAPGGESDSATRLVSALAARDTLIVLDNCEHVIEPAAALADRLLASAPACASSPPAGSRSASPESGCGRSGRSTPVTPCGCSPSGRPPNGPAIWWTSSATPSSASAASSTACRLPSSWPPPGSACCRPGRSPSGSAIGSGCSPAEAVRPYPATRRSAPSWTGAGTCSTPASARSPHGWRCSRAGPRWRPPSRSASGDPARLVLAHAVHGITSAGGEGNLAQAGRSLAVTARYARDIRDAAPHPLVAIAVPIMSMFSGLRQETEAQLEPLLGHPDGWVAASARVFRAHLHFNAGRSEEGEADLVLALDTFRTVGDRWGVGNCLSVIAETNVMRGDLRKAVPLMKEAIALLEEVGAVEETPFLRARLAVALRAAGDREAAEAALRETERLCGATGDPSGRPGRGTCGATSLGPTATSRRRGVATTRPSGCCGPRRPSPNSRRR